MVALSHALATEEDQIWYAVAARFEDLLLDIIAVSAANANLCHARIVAAEPSVRVMRRRVPHIRQVMSVISTTACMNNNSISLVAEWSCECRVHGIEPR